MMGFLRRRSCVCFALSVLFAKEQKLLNEMCLENNRYLSHPSASTPADILLQSRNECSLHVSPDYSFSCTSVHLETAFVPGR